MRYVLGSRASIGGVLGSGRGGGLYPWYLAGGVSAANCVAAYQPKGAASLAASYVNLANPGTYTAAPGVAPTFAAATGWTFNGSTQYLTTGVVPASDQTWSIIFRYSDLTGTGNRSIGAYRNGNQAAFCIVASQANSGMVVYNGLGFPNSAINTPILTGGTYALAGRIAYRNGSAEAAIVPVSTASTAIRPLFIGAFNFGTTTDVADSYMPAKIQAVAIYNVTLSAPQVAAISSAMSLL